MSSLEINHRGYIFLLYCQGQCMLGRYLGGLGHVLAVRKECVTLCKKTSKYWSYIAPWPFNRRQGGRGRSRWAVVGVTHKGRTVGRSENLEGRQVCSNLVGIICYPLVEIGLTDLQKSKGPWPPSPSRLRQPCKGRVGQTCWGQGICLLKWFLPNFRPVAYYFVCDSIPPPKFDPLTLI